MAARKTTKARTGIKAKRGTAKRAVARKKIAKSGVKSKTRLKKSA